MYYIFVLSSVTYALKGKRLLEENGIRSAPVKTGVTKALRGCGYGLKVKAEQCGAAREILLSQGIKILGTVGDGQ